MKLFLTILSLAPVLSYADYTATPCPNLTGTYSCAGGKLTVRQNDEENGDATRYVFLSNGVETTDTKARPGVGAYHDGYSAYSFCANDEVIVFAADSIITFSANESGFTTSIKPNHDPSDPRITKHFCTRN